MSSTYSSMTYHFVFATKSRAHTIKPEWMSALHAYLGGTAKGLGGTPLAINGTSDHVHLLIALRPSHCVADFVRDLKKASSTWVKETHGGQGFGWQEGYGVFTVGWDGVPKAREYIAEQQAHHKTVDSRTEYLAMCEGGGIKVDMRFFE